MPLLVLLATSLVGCEPSTGEPTEEEIADLPVGTEVGERAPMLNGITANESDFELTPGGTDYTVLVFYRGYECGLCRLRLEELGRHSGAYGGADAQVIVAAPDTPERIEAAEGSADGATGVAVDRPTLDRWGVTDARGVVLPATFLIDRHGVIRYRHIGRNAGDRASDAEVLSAIRQDRERRQRR